MEIVDTEIEDLKHLIELLENEISVINAEKGEIERQVYQYQVRYNQELGELLQKLFEKRRDKLKVEAEKEPTKENKYQEAERDYQEFKGEYERSSQIPKPAEISEEEQIEMKALFRKACKKCHPDKLPEDLKEKAEQFFVELKDAYDSNNLQKVKEISEMLESGIFDRSVMDEKEKERLLKIYESLKTSLENLKSEIAGLKESEIFKQIQTITDLNKYFETLKAKLTIELAQI